MLRTALLAGTVLAALGGAIAVPAMAQLPDPDSLFWQSLDPARADEVEAYLRTFPDGHFKEQAVAALARDAATPGASPGRLDVGAWLAIDRKSPAALQSYLLAFPHGVFAPLARVRLGEALTGLPLGPQPQPATAAAPSSPAAATTPAGASAVAAAPPVSAPRVTAPANASAATASAAAPSPATAAPTPASVQSPQPQGVTQPSPPATPAAPAQPAAAAPKPQSAIQPEPAATAPQAVAASPAAAGPAVAAPPAEPATQVANATPAAPAAAPAAAVPAPPPVMEVVRTAILRAEPTVRSQALHEFAPGERLEVGQAVPDGRWYRLDSGKWHGYVAASVLKSIALAVPPVPSVKPKPADAAAASAGSAAAAVVSGPVQVVDTGDLIVAGRRLALFGIQGLGAPYDAGMAAFLAKEGGMATCRARSEGQFVCVTEAGVDLAEAALVNGAAKAAPDAPADYQDQQKDAKANKRGIWAQ